MENNRLRRVLFALIVIAAIACIGFGGYRVWESFTEFDENIMREKDEQFYSLIRSDDINISNSLEAFTRESESFFVRQRLSQLRKEWADSKNHNTADLNEYFRNSPLMSNPVCAEIGRAHV